MNEKIRNSNIELLRILTAMGIMILHYNNTTMGRGLTLAENYSINQMFLILLESLFICGVNLFVLISGYFLSTSNRRDLLKPIKLICEVIIFNYIFYFIQVIRGIQEFSVEHFISRILPVNWYVMIYIGLYIISPYLNLLFNKLDTRRKKQLLILSILTFCVYPTLTDMLVRYTGRRYMGLSTIEFTGSGSGYTIINFVIIYLIGCYIRNNNTKYKFSRLLRLMILNFILIFLWALSERLCLYSWGDVSWSYCNPLVIFEAVLIFLIFKQININSIVINKLAKASFTMYLIHNHFLEIIRIPKYVNRNIFILMAHVIISVCIVYLVAFMVSFIYDFIMNHIWGVIDKRWKKYRFYDTEV